MKLSYKKLVLTILMICFGSPSLGAAAILDQAHIDQAGTLLITGLLFYQILLNRPAQRILPQENTFAFGLMGCGLMNLARGCIRSFLVKVLANPLPQVVAHDC
jgi:hypothetical protein